MQYVNVECFLPKFILLLVNFGVIQSGFGAHPASYPMSKGAVSPGIKRPGREADYPPPTSVEVKNMRIYTSTPPYVFMA
jgi:hypothetical protein